jgi:hypothetical protein
VWPQSEGSRDAVLSFPTVSFKIPHRNGWESMRHCKICTLLHRVYTSSIGI